jgi:hypothetical protein
MSALGPKTEVAALRRDVCLTPMSGQSQVVSACPKSAEGGSQSAVFDHLVDLRKRRCRHSETERFGSFEIEDQRDFAGCWTGQSSGRPLAFTA